MTLDALLRGAAGGDARGEARGVEADVARVAGLLRADGVRRGDAVCFRAPNTEATICLYRACWRLGAAAVPIHALATDAEAARIAAAVHPVAGPDLDLSGRFTAVDDDAADPADTAVVLFTSGSSGTPKGVRLSHRALASKARTMVRVHGLTPDDAVLMPAPLAHVSGLLNAILVAGAVPMRAVLMARWDPEEALSLIERERITFMVGPPTFFLDLLSAPGVTSERVRSLRLISSGGAGITPAFVDRAREGLGCVVKRTYGSTEAPTVTTSYAGDDPERARTTDGRPVGDVELRIDPATGELQLRGSDIFDGYTDPDATAAAFTPDGWFRTGDLGAIDDEGWLTIVGRLKDVIIRGGENISAAEVEGVLEAHPSVTAAAVVGYPDERLGERVAAFVVATGDLDVAACGAWCADRGLARFKTPERVVVVDALPLLPSGKPDREALRRRAAVSPSPTTP